MFQNRDERPRMTSAPEPADFAQPGQPRDAASRSPPRRGFGLAFWVMLAFSLVCVLSGLVIGRFGPALFPLKTPPRAVAARPGTPTRPGADRPTQQAPAPNAAD